MTDKRKSNCFGLLILLSLAASLMLRQLTGPGYFSVMTDDSISYTRWAWQFREALQEGILYPRWISSNFWGYGSPTFIFYSPLAFYLTAILGMFTKTLLLAMNMAKFLAMFISAAGVYFLVKEFYPEKTALITAAFHMFLPANILQYYFFGGFASVVSFAWFPLILLFIARYLKNGTYRHLVSAGLCYGGLLLTHLINAYMFTFVMILFILSACKGSSIRRNLMAIPCIMTTGLMVAACYLLPLVWEKKFINMAGFIRKGEGLHYSDFFLLPKMTGNLPSTNYWVVYYDNFLLNTVFSIVLVLLMYMILRKLPDSAQPTTIPLSSFAMTLAILTLLLLFGISRPVWEIIPYFNYVQLPARWLNFTSLAITLLFASACGALSARGRRKYALALITVLFCICLVFDYHFIINAHQFSQQELMSEQPITWNVEHLPKGANLSIINRDKLFSEKAVIVKGKGKTDIVSWKSAERILQVTAQEPLTIRIGTFNFPGWKASANRRQIIIRTEQETGAILMDVPNGEHRLRLTFEDTPVRHYGKIVSGLFLLLLTSALFFL